MEKVRKWTLRASAVIVLSLVGLLLAGAGGGVGYFFGKGGFSGMQANQPRQQLTVRVGERNIFDDRVRASVDLPAGVLTFDASTPDTAGYTVLLVKVPDGVTIDEYLNSLAALSNTGTDDPAKGEKYKMANYGGARVAAGSKCAVSFTTVLQAGTYHVLAFWGAGISDPHPLVQEIRVTGDAANAKLPAAANQIVLDEGAGKPRFQTPDQWPVDGRFLVTNNTSLPSEAVFLPLKPGTSDDDLKGFFLADGAEPNWLAAPFSEFRVCGMAPVSPGRQVLVHITSVPDDYVLASFTFNPKFNKRQYQLGMYKRFHMVSMP